MNSFFNNPVDYGFYLNNYGATLSPALTIEQFGLYEVRARRFLRNICASAIPNEHLDEYFSCVCAMTEEMLLQSSHTNIKSESIDGYSVTYIDDIVRKKRLYRIALQYLSGFGVLYQGVE